MHYPAYVPAPAAPKPELVAPRDIVLPAAPWILAIAAFAGATLWPTRP